MDKPRKRIYNIVDFYAATFYYRDLKLHAICDQADIGLYSEIEKINFHQAWDSCPNKNYYKQSARAFIDSDKEISCLKSNKWDSYGVRNNGDS